MTDGIDVDALTEEQASERAIANRRTTTFSVCPVCNGYIESTGPTMSIEARLQGHCETHTAEEYLRAINRIRDETAARVEQNVRQQIAADLESKRPHIPVSTDPKRRESLIVRSTLNRAARLARGGSDAN